MDKEATKMAAQLEEEEAELHQNGLTQPIPDHLVSIAEIQTNKPLTIFRTSSASFKNSTHVSRHAIMG